MGHEFFDVRKEAQSFDALRRLGVNQWDAAGTLADNILTYIREHVQRKPLIPYDATIRDGKIYFRDVSLDSLLGAMRRTARPDQIAEIEKVIGRLSAMQAAFVSGSASHGAVLSRDDGSGRHYIYVFQREGNAIKSMALEVIGDEAACQRALKSIADQTGAVYRGEDSLVGYYGTSQMKEIGFARVIRESLTGGSLNAEQRDLLARVNLILIEDPNEYERERERLQAELYRRLLRGESVASLASEYLGLAADPWQLRSGWTQAGDTQRSEMPSAGSDRSSSTAGTGHVPASDTLTLSFSVLA